MIKKELLKKFLPVAIILVIIFSILLLLKKETNPCRFDGIYKPDCGIPTLDSVDQEWEKEINEARFSEHVEPQRVVLVKDVEIYLPIIKNLDERIVQKIQQQLTFESIQGGTTIDEYNEEYKDIPVVGISHLGFEVQRDDGKILTIIVDNEWCNAYCSYRTESFTFDVVTGERLLATDILETSSAQALGGKCNDIAESLLDQEKTLIREEGQEGFSPEDWKRYFDDTHADLFVRDEEYGDCGSQLFLQSFGIDENALFIYYDFGFPHALQVWAPYKKIEIPLSELNLKDEFKYLEKENDSDESFIYYYGEDFEVAKNRLEKVGWKTYLPNFFEEGYPFDHNYPEITSCGNGIDKICSVDFKKGPVYRHLNLSSRDGRWIVVGDE